MSNKYIQKMLGNTDRLGSGSALNECGSIALVQEKVESVKQVFFLLLKPKQPFFSRTQIKKLNSNLRLYSLEIRIRIPIFFLSKYQKCLNLVFFFSNT